MTTFRRIAVHEAGHAVAAIALGGKFRVAYGTPRAHASDDAARITFGSLDGVSELSGADLAVVALAGRAAEVVVHEDVERRLADHAAVCGVQLPPRTDRVTNDLASRHATDHDTYLALTGRTTIDAKDVERALGIVERSIAAIQRVADALLGETSDGLAFDSLRGIVGAGGDAVRE